MLHIVIPAYNEERRLPRTLRELRRYVSAHRAVLGDATVVVVDNGSTDRTAELAREADRPALPVRVVRCAVRGKGAAVRAGLLATAAADDDLVCFMDADGATGLDALLEAWRRTALGADVVIGSRGLPGSRTDVRSDRVRSTGAACYRRLTARLLPDIADTQCGFKVFRGEVARRAAGDLRARGFSFDVELLVRLRAAGARIDEIPVTWADVPGSTFVPARHGAGAFAELAAIAWRTRRLAAGTLTAGSAAGAGPRSPMTRPAPVALPVPLAVPQEAL
ncbi:glycosyltransferase involved in cell wall biosynthesis [Nocardioides thalensis]|uniref:Glycosyltransferase involved in cell wall biosynthesis n=1 Tax=Nocardioides thalensis TaxID=1914755 RepID=A0A853C0Y3_9ACTN|nr:glycosyltransferase [Nocardioides thalensis]NYJ01039.1 glycosyltransferase involved in cell wall biosynthesis [Nocardioides thalensis]